MIGKRSYADIFGKTETKAIKTFLATSKYFGGVIRVIIVMEPHGPVYFYCTVIYANLGEILESFADRSVIEQVYLDVKEVWGSDQQQVHNIWSSVACRNLNLWMHTWSNYGVGTARQKTWFTGRTLRETIRIAALRVPTNAKPCKPPASDRSITLVPLPTFVLSTQLVRFA